MGLNSQDQDIIRLLQKGLPFVQKPFSLLASNLKMQERELISHVNRMDQDGIIKRFGVIVKHRQLGFVHNGMVVWDILDDQIDGVAEKIAAYDFVNLCYQRDRCLPQWPYNLFCMIHGRSREMVKLAVEIINSECRLEDVPCDILFSTECYKQRGARYF